MFDGTNTQEHYMREVMGHLGYIGTQNGYKEGKEALQGLISLSWFDNFGMDIYRERLIAMNNIFHEYESLQQEYPEVYNESKEHGMTILGDN